MSAFLVSDEHISYLVSAAMLWRVGWSHNGKRRDGLAGTNLGHIAGHMLRQENIKSLEARYGDEGGPEHRYQVNLNIKPVQVLKAISCYEYQSCEHEGWETSEAYVFCQALRHEAIRRLPGYEEAQWEIRK